MWSCGECVIVNADDFGMSTSVNRAILFAIERGLISRASMMVNMPGFLEACEAARRLHWEERLGVHLNLSEGRPLTAAITRCRRFCDDNGFFRPRQRVFRLSAEERKAAEEELGAQVRAFIAQGIRPAHLDSHHHYHTEWGIAGAVISVAQAAGIRAVRLSRNCGPRIDPAKRAYKTAFNARLALCGLAANRYFGSVHDVSGVIGSGAGRVEVMVHPRLRPGGQVTDMDGHEPLEQLLERAGIPCFSRGSARWAARSAARSAA